MLQFFGDTTSKVLPLNLHPLTPKSIDKLYWLFGKAPALEVESIEGKFVGPRATMITPWSTNAVKSHKTWELRELPVLKSIFQHQWSI